MGKTKKSDERLTMAMWLGMVGAAVDTMVEAGLESRHVHSFLDRLQEATHHILRGESRAVIHDMLEVVREAVPAND